MLANLHPMLPCPSPRSLPLPPRSSRRPSMSLLQLVPMVTQLAAAVLLLLRKSAAMVSTHTFSILHLLHALLSLWLLCAFCMSFERIPFHFSTTPSASYLQYHTQASTVTSTICIQSSPSHYFMMADRHKIVLQDWHTPCSLCRSIPPSSLSPALQCQVTARSLIPNPKALPTPFTLRPRCLLHRPIVPKPYV